MTQQFQSWQEKIENICPHKNLYTNIHSSIIDNDQKVKTIQSLIDE